MTETAWQPPRTRYFCPMPECGWVCDEPAAVLAAGLTADVTAAMHGQLAETENTLRAHLETHSLLEWLREVQRLREASERPRRLVTQWRTAADALKSTNAAWSSHFYDCANELERLLTP